MSHTSHDSATAPGSALRNSRRPPLPGSVRLGPAEPDAVLTVTVRVRRHPGAPSLPALDPHPARRRHLSREEFGSRYGASDADLAQIAAFAARHGLAVTDSDREQRSMHLSGTATRMEQAFGVQLGTYRLGQTRHRGFEGAVRVPRELSGIVEAVLGLDDRPLARPLLQQAAGSLDTTPLTPQQVATLYGFPPGSAAGQTIGILEFGGGFLPSDVQAYFQTVAGLPVPDVQFVSIDGAVNAAPALVPASGSAVNGYFGSDTSQHVNFIGIDGHVHELYAHSGFPWLDNDLTAFSGGMTPAAGTALDGYWGTDNSQHVHFIGTDGHLHEYYIEPGSNWADNDLTVSSGGMTPAAGTRLHAYWGMDGSQHVHFVGTDGHLHEYYLEPGAGWADNDLTLSSGGVAPAAGTALDSYWGGDGSQHVNFIGIDGHVHEYYLEPGAGWADNDLTAASGGILPVAGTALDGYWQADGGQHVDFIGIDGHVHELYIHSGATWEDNDLTAAAGSGVIVAAGSPLDGYFGSDTSQHINFIGTDGHVHELYANPGEGWKDNDLSVAAAGALPASGTTLDGYWQADDSQHVNFIGNDGHIHELYLDPGSAWQNNDLSLNNDQVETALDIAVAGSAAPGARIVVYIAPNNEQGWVDALSTAIHDAANAPSVISISWGGDEDDWGAISGSFGTVLADAAALGVTVLSSSGDGGSEQPASVAYPASDPMVTGCGGTTVQDVSGWSFTQTAWGGSGGGISNLFDLPSWQDGAGVPASINPQGHVGRGVPDIAGNADPNSGYALVLGGIGFGFIGGTSAVVPLYAGLVALLNAQLGAPVGYLNPTLYGLSNPCVFDDVTTGSNTGYAAGTGWDAVTGLGSVNGEALAYALVGDIGPSGSIALRAQSSSMQLDAAAVDGTGALQVSWVTGTGTWSGPTTVQGPGFAPAQARVAFGYQASDNQLDAVVVDNTGAVSVCWVDGGGSWAGPLQVSAAGYAPPGAAVALASQVSTGQLDAVLVDNTGTLSAFWVDGGGNWNGPLAISQPGYAPAGAAVALAHQVTAGQLDAVLVDETGTLSAFWVDGGGNWNGPLAISQPGFAPPGASVALHYQVSLSQLDAIVVDNTGTLSAFWVGGDGGWSGPLQISAPDFAPPGAGLAMEHQVNWQQLDVVVVDNTGALSVFSVVGDGSWTGPLAISPPGYTTPGTGVALAHQVSREQLNAVVPDNTGALSVFYVEGAGTWEGPVAVPILAAMS